MIRLLFLLLISLTLWGEEITIIHTTDLHGYLTKDYEDKSFGFLQIAQATEELKTKYPDYLWIDTGDNCAGSFEAWYTKNDILYKALCQAGCHFFIPGNHEMDYGAKRFTEIFEQYRNKMICANLQVMVKNKSWPIPQVRYVMRKGLKIAIIGATLDSFDAIHLTHNKDQIQIKPTPIRPLLSSILAKVHKEKADFIILAIHQGLPPYHKSNTPIHQIAKSYPEIDLILGGHTHTGFPGILLYPRTWYVQAPCHGEGLALIQIRKKRGKKAKITSQIIEVSKYAKNKSMLNFLQQDLAQINQFGKQKAFTLQKPLDSSGIPGRDCTYSEIFHAAFSQKVPVDATLQGKFNCPSLRPGEINQRLFFSLIPYDNMIFTASLTQNELKMIIRENEKHNDKIGYAALHGIFWHYDKKKDNVTLFLPPHLKEKKTLDIAFIAYMATGSGNRFPLTKKILQNPKAKLQNTGVDSRQCILEWLQANPKLIQPTHWEKTTPDSK